MNDNILSNAKAWAALIGAIVTALLGTTAPDTTLFQTLAAISAVATAITVYRVPNQPTRNERGALSAVDALVVALIAFAVVVLVAWLR